MAELINEAQVKKIEGFYESVCRPYCLAALGYVATSGNPPGKLPVCANGGNKTLLKAIGENQCPVGSILAKDQEGKNHLVEPVTLSENGAVASGDGSLESEGLTQCSRSTTAGAKITHSIRLTGQDSSGSITFEDLKPINP